MPTVTYDTDLQTAERVIGFISLTALRDRVAEAIAAEREKCAQIAEAMDSGRGNEKEIAPLRSTKAATETSCGAQIFPTEEGIAILGDFVPLPTGRELQEYWSAKLPSGEWRVLSVAIDAYPDAVPRSDIDSATGFKKSSRDTYITRLRARRLLTVDAPGEIRASDTLF